MLGQSHEKNQGDEEEPAKEEEQSGDGLGTKTKKHPRLQRKGEFHMKVVVTSSNSSKQMSKIWAE